MISAVGKAPCRPASGGPSGNPLNDLVADTKKIFELVRRTKALLARNFPSHEIVQLREEHSQLLLEEQELVRRHCCIQHGVGGSLRSFFIRFRFRLAELDQQPGHPTGRTSSDFLSRLDQLIQQLMQHDPVDTGKFLQEVFEHYRHGLTKKIQSLQPPTPTVPYRSAKIDTMSTMGPVSPLMSPTRGLIRVLSCNEKLMRCWATQGKRNYEPLQIDPTLKEIYFFTRTQDCNATLMFEEMMERNKDVQSSRQIYDRQYKRYQNWARLQQRNNRRHTRKEVQTTETKERSKSKSKVSVAPKQQQKQKSQAANRLAFGRTMFRIRPAPERAERPKLSEPLNLLNETVSQFGRNIYRQSRPPTTIRIEFRSIRDVTRG